MHFVIIFKKTFSLNYIQHSEKGNCEDDCGSLLNEVVSFGTTGKQTTPLFLPVNVVKDTLVTVNCTDFRELDLLSENALSYVCGYLYRKCLNFHKNCAPCLNASKTTTEINSSNIFCDFKAYDTKDHRTFGNLFMPGEDFIKFVREMQIIFDTNFERLAILPNVGRNLVDLFSHIRFETNCQEFPREYVMKLFCRIKIYHTLKRANVEFKSAPRKQRKMINILHL